jgi:hypothetical protein
MVLFLQENLTSNSEGVFFLSGVALDEEIALHARPL